MSEKADHAQVFVDALVDNGFPSKFFQLPGDESFETNRQTHFNLDMICHPLLFMTPTSTEEVSKAVRGYAKGLKEWQQASQKAGNEKNDAPGLCICGGRHSTRSFKEGKVVLDLSLMQQVTVDVENQTVTVEGGVKIGKMLDALAPHHLAPVTGTHTDTGVIGLTLGGGQGFLSKRFGPAVDQIVSIEIVLADGKVKTVQKDNMDSQEDADILFNIRGGGGNIGVVTRLTMKVYPIRNVGFMESVNFVFTQKGVEDVLVKYGEWSLSAPDDCSSIAILPFGAPVVIGAGVSSSMSQIPQDIDAKTAYSSTDPSQIPGLAELRSNGLGAWFRLPTKFSVKDFCAEAMEATSKEPPGYYYYTNVFVPTISREIAAVLAEASRGKLASGIKGAIICFNGNGAKTEQVPVAETAFEMRDKKFWVLCQTEWKGGDKTAAAEREKVVEFNRWFRRAIIAAGGQKTIHAVTGQEEDYGEKTDFGLWLRVTNKDRMIETQKRLDPDGIFRINHFE